MWSAGETPGSPLGYLTSMQQEDGRIRYKASEEQNGVWMTAQVAPAFAGEWLPIPPVPLKEEQPSPASREAGAGGESSQQGPGVITGGGGKGAPLFSRPQPQSQGRTPDGVRLLEATRARAAQREKAYFVFGDERRDWSFAPVPDRGKRCEPAHTRNVAEQIAKLRGVSVEEIAARTTTTAREFFRFGR